MVVQRPQRKYLGLLSELYKELYLVGVLLHWLIIARIQIFAKIHLGIIYFHYCSTFVVHLSCNVFLPKLDISEFDKPNSCFSVPGMFDSLGV